MTEPQKCSSCGTLFTVKIPKGMHHPKDCPEALDTMCPSCYDEVYELTECASCRPKQDMQRS